MKCHFLKFHFPLFDKGTISLFNWLYFPLLTFSNNWNKNANVGKQPSESHRSNLGRAPKTSITLYEIYQARGSKLRKTWKLSYTKNYVIEGILLYKNIKYSLIIIIIGPLCLSNWTCLVLDSIREKKG